MKQHSSHHKHFHHDDNHPGSLLDRCGHYFAHRIGSKKRGQESVLSVIAEQPGITQKELAQSLDIQPASVSELLMKLEHKGLVLRTKDEQDRRSIKVRLTEEGQSLLAKPKEEIEDPFQVLSPEEQAQLCALLNKLLADWEHRYPMERGRHKHHKHHHTKEDHNGNYE